MYVRCESDSDTSIPHELPGRGMPCRHPRSAFGRSERFDRPALDTVFLAVPVANKGSLTQYVGRILRSQENKTTAEVHDYLDERTGVLAACSPSARPATPDSASPTRAGSH